MASLSWIAKAIKHHRRKGGATARPHASRTHALPSNPLSLTRGTLSSRRLVFGAPSGECLDQQQPARPLQPSARSQLPEMALPLLGAAPAFDSACPPPQATLSVRCGLRVQLSREPNGYMGFIQPCGEEIVNLFRILHFI